jgi:hypothetical protein
MSLRYPHIVYVEGCQNDGKALEIFSWHRSFVAAHKSFRKCCRGWAGKRILLIDRDTGWRRQRDRRGNVSGEFAGLNVAKWCAMPKEPQ